MTLHQTIAQAVKAARKYRGWSQEELAHRAGVHQPHVSRVERAASGVSFATLEQLATALNMRVCIALEPNP